jgi:hypothetical protein
LIQRKPTPRNIGFFFFSIAFFLGLLLILVRAIPDLEAMMYGFIRYNYPPLPSLSCPVLMTTSDREPVTIHLRNTLDKPVTWTVRSQLSTNLIINTKDEKVELQPGESRKLSWEVGEENIDLNNFILARIFTSSSSSLKMRESTCGTLVLQLPIKGGPAIYYSSLFFTMLFAVVGFWLWFHHSEKSDPAVTSQSMWMRFSTLVIIVGLIASYFDWWFLGILMVALALILLGMFLIPRKD